MFHLSRVLKRATEVFSDRIAVEDGRVTLTYAEIGERVGALARALSQRGVATGDRVALLDRNSFRAIEIHFACAAIGAVLVPLNVRLASAEIANVLRDTEAVLTFHSESLAHSVPSAFAAICWPDEGGLDAPNPYELLLAQSSPLDNLSAEPTSIAQIFYTSGTGGDPKGVCLTHANLVASAYDAIAALALRSTDVWLHVAPMFHLVDAFAIWAVTMVGGRHVIRHFEPASFADDVERYGVTKTSMPPTLVALAVGSDTEFDPRYSTLDFVSYGGSPMADALRERAAIVLGAPMLQAYGITETSGIITQERPDNERVQSAGTPTCAVDIRLVNDALQDVEPGEVGEILVAGPRVMAGYWRKPEATTAAMLEGRWYRTGDLGVRHKAGNLSIVGRKKDMVITGGENVYPAEVENVLMLHPAVLEAAVFGIPSERWGEEVRAAVVVREGTSVDEAQLIEFCRDRIGGYKIPKSFQFGTEPLPKTGPGKVAKTILREPFWSKTLQIGEHV